eukprot:m.60616 g.60616  ORF g.60616 m.60616 type:complete len:51 (+) comp22860_c0_seq2:125-277(+)
MSFCVCVYPDVRLCVCIYVTECVMQHGCKCKVEFFSSNSNQKLAHFPVTL